MNYTWLAAAAISFCAVFLKGFQHKNVLGNHYTAVFITSYLMAVFDVLAVGIIVKGGWVLCFPVGTGAAIGIVISMWTHDRLFKRKEKR